jgi:hypothetical protein
MHTDLGAKYYLPSCTAPVLYTLMHCPHARNTPLQAAYKLYHRPFCSFVHSFHLRLTASRYGLEHDLMVLLDDLVRDLDRKKGHNEDVRCDSRQRNKHAAA